MRSEFRLAPGLDEGAVAGTELVLDDYGQLEQFDVVAVQDLSIDEGRGHENLADLGVHADREVMSSEGDAAIDGEFFGVIGGVGGDADFASSDDAGSTIFLRGFDDRDLAGEVEDRTGDWRQCAELVGGLTGVQVEVPSLTVGRNRGQKKQEKQTDADHVRLTGLHQYVPSPVGKCTLPRIPRDRERGSRSYEGSSE